MYDIGVEPNPVRSVIILEGRPIVFNKKLFVNPSCKRHGVAKTAIARQIRAALNCDGFSAIWVDADGSGYDNQTATGERPMEGYDYWPGLGFDGDLNSKFWKYLLQSDQDLHSYLKAKGVTTIADLRSLPIGTAIWKNYGVATLMKIKLSESNPAINWVGSHLQGLGI